MNMKLLLIMMIHIIVTNHNILLLIITIPWMKQYLIGIFIVKVKTRTHCTHILLSTYYEKVRIFILQN